MLGKITLEIMMDPVLTPSGLTYDRHEIQEHLEKVGAFDPVSMVLLKKEDLVPNRALKEAVDEFLFENGWASEW